MSNALMQTAEFERIANRLGSCELVRGSIAQLSFGEFPFSKTCANVAYVLGEWSRRKGRGGRLACNAGVITQTEPDTVRGAAVVFLSYERLAKGAASQGFLSIAPELVVEVVGKGHGWQDLLEKAGEYFAMGVTRVWIVDPKTLRVHVFSSDTEPVAYSTDAAMADEELLPGFSCRVAEFFTD